jgi:alpha-amylase/alpha-mannosidase (GH57 family)
MGCFVCIHCHFYQPPRENAWLEAVESQDSASPYHDWNERITAECYLPNGASRMLDGRKRITKIVNNYARISFNFGPTLLSWMEERAPQAYEQVLEADRESQKSFSGHGSAIAQAYNHLILPLANSRDKRTQIVWGIRDFQHRFGRDPEGMWLPETAVDLETLEILSSLGIKFTILAPHQAAKMRTEKGKAWINLHGQGIDSRRAYTCNLRSGDSFGLFFYDGVVSRAVAFEKLLFNGENLARRLTGRFDPEGDSAQLIHIATDGETYGHHHSHGDMALAYALDYIEKNKLARITNYGEYFAQHPPSQEVEILERTSWSCMHGIARWESDCGCNSGANHHWKQAWRRPLREALNWLRDELDAMYEVGAKDLLRDPWTARDEYAIAVIDRSADTADSFLAEHALRELSPEEATRALRLLEMQRHLMLMYTSCGWFFDEPTGPETVQVLQYAGRAVQLSEQLFGGEREEQFLTRLEKVWSNISEFGNGRSIYERFVRPAMLDLCGVAAHYAISSLFDGYRDSTSMYRYHAQLQDVYPFEKGGARLAVGRARITSRTTRGELQFNFAALHLGGHKLVAGIHPCHDSDGFRPFAEQTCAAFSAGDLAGCSLLIDQHFRGDTYSLKSLFRDERQRIVKQIVNSTLADIDEMYAKVHQQHASLISFLSELHMPMPAILRASAEFVLGNAIQRCLADERLDADHIRRLLEAARQNATSLVGCGLESALGQRLEIVLDRWAKNAFDLSKLGEVEAVASLAQVPPFHLDLWQAQNVYYGMLQAILRTQPVQFTGEWLDRFQQLGERLGVAVGESLSSRGSKSLEIVPSHPTSGLVRQAGPPAVVAGAVMMSSPGLQTPADPGMTSA